MDPFMDHCDTTNDTTSDTTVTFLTFLTKTPSKPRGKVQKCKID